ncbi:MAG: hypothetical protein R6U17_02835 [Thermoplasmata archaeon]
MCKYLYGTDKYEGGRCAHPSNLSIACVGEDSCRLMSSDVDMLEVDEKEYTDNTGENCPNTTCGIYCQKYQRFYCAGEENCQTEDEYKKHMNMYSGL